MYSQHIATASLARGVADNRIRYDTTSSYWRVLYPHKGDFSFSPQKGQF